MDAERLPFGSECVVSCQFAVCRFACAGKDFEGFGGLSGADDADERGKHAEQGAGAVVGGVAVKQAGVARAVSQVGAVHGDLSFEADGGAGNQRGAGGDGGAVDGLAGGIVVGAVEDDVGGTHEFGQAGFVQFLGQCGNVARAVDGFQTTCHHLRFGLSDIGFGEGGLALEVGIVYGVVVDDDEFADARSGKIRECRRTQPAAADDEDAGSEDFFLPFDTDFVEKDVAAVTEQLLVVHNGSSECWYRGWKGKTERVSRYCHDWAIHLLEARRATPSRRLPSVVSIRMPHTKGRLKPQTGFQTTFLFVQSKIDVFVGIVKYERAAFAAAFGFEVDACHHHGLVDFFHHVVDGYEGDVDAGNGFGRDAFATFGGNGNGGFDVGEFDIDIEIDADVLQGEGLVKRDKQSDLLDALDGGDTGDVEDACVLGGVFRQNFDGGGAHVDGAACYGGADGGLAFVVFAYGIEVEHTVPA